jgi:hypothetical protein
MQQMYCARLPTQQPIVTTKLCCAVQGSTGQLRAGPEALTDVVYVSCIMQMGGILLTGQAILGQQQDAHGVLLLCRDIVATSGASNVGQQNTGTW